MLNAPLPIQRGKKAYPPQVIKQPIVQIIKLRNLLLVAVKTTFGELYTPVPIILLRIKALKAGISEATSGDDCLAALRGGKPAQLALLWDRWELGVGLISGPCRFCRRLRRLLFGSVGMKQSCAIGFVDLRPGAAMTA